MTGTPRFQEACSPLYPAVMAEKQLMEERARGEKPLGLEDDLVVHMHGEDKPGKCAWKVVVVPLALFLLIVHAVENGWFVKMLSYLQAKPDAVFPTAPTPPDICTNGAPDIRHLWGQYSPYHAAPSSHLDSSIPPTCNVTFVSSIARHGSRFPTAKKGRKYAKAIHRIQSAAPSSAFVGPYTFLENYTYEFGADELTTAGRLEMLDFGVDFYNRYSSLINRLDTATPFVRTTDSQRVEESAQLFTRSLHLARLDGAPDGVDPEDVVEPKFLIIPESPDINNTLCREQCRAAHVPPVSKVEKNAQKAFGDRWLLPLAERLSDDLQLHGDDRLSVKELVYLMDMCPFDFSAALHPLPPSDRTGGSGMGVGPFCGLFGGDATEDEWVSYAYYQSLGKFYGYGQGNPLGPSIGAGWVNELRARLTGQPVHDRTSVNRTLDANPDTFPIGDVAEQGARKRAAVFADFSHDNEITSIMAALGLYNASGYDDASHSSNRASLRRVMDDEDDGDEYDSYYYDEDEAESLEIRSNRRDDTGEAGPDVQRNQRRRTSAMLPILTRKAPWEVHGFSAAWTVPFGMRMYVEGLACAGVDEMLVRVLVNERVIDLAEHACGGDARGMCRLSDFIDSLDFARTGGDWDRCFV